jgi:hypothetical protein
MGKDVIAQAQSGEYNSVLYQYQCLSVILARDLDERLISIGYE